MFDATQEPVAKGSPILFLGSLLAFFGVALGAFGAHAFKATLEANKTLETYQTGSHYHLIHAVALLLVVVLPISEKFRKVVATLFVMGILIFSGSLYLYSLTKILIFAIITPLGGLSFMAGWVVLAYAALPSPRKS